MALLTDLVSYWKLDEASGNALDAHGSNDLTETSGTIDATTGILSGGRDFESGDTEHFELADNTDLSAGDIDFSIQAWINAETSGGGTYRAAVSKWDSADLEYWLGIDNSGKPAFFVRNTADSATVAATWGSAISTGTWYCVHAWHDSVNNLIGIAVNAGTPVTTSHSGGVRDSVEEFRIGAQGPGGATPNYFDGIIDEVGFWKRVLTTDERTSLYNSGVGLAYPFSSGNPWYAYAQQ